MGGEAEGQLTDMGEEDAAIHRHGAWDHYAPRTGHSSALSKLSKAGITLWYGGAQTIPHKKQIGYACCITAG